MEVWDYAFDPEKNAWLIRERGISFEQIIALIEAGHLIRVLEHPKMYNAIRTSFCTRLTSRVTCTSCRWSSKVEPCF